jgi:hypothetical protein
LEQADIEFCLRLQEEEVLTFIFISRLTDAHPLSHTQSVRAYQAQQAAVQASLQDDDSEEARAFRLGKSPITFLLNQFCKLIPVLY